MPPIKLSMFGVRTVADIGMEFLREGDRFLMQVFVRQGYSTESLLRLNRVRVYRQVLFLSDILMASSKKIDMEIIVQSQIRHKLSRLRWPTEHPTKSDFQLWRDAVTALRPSWTTRTRLGLFIAPTHRIWIGDRTRVQDACTNLAKTERLKKCSRWRRNQTGFTIWRHSQPRDKGPSAQWSPHKRGRSGEDGD